jgi:1-deoxy-D-xylulose-5-phosphate reductoisomerase
MIGVAILGSTGTVGEHTLDVIARHPDRFRVIALGAHRNASKLAEQALRFRVPYAALADESAAAKLEKELRARGATTRVVGGAQALEEIARLPEPLDCVPRWRLPRLASGCCWLTRNRWSWPGHC